MNEHETIELLKLRMALSDQKYNRSDVEIWADQLGDVDRGEAVVAMRRACANHAAVNWYQFRQELAAHRHGRQNAQKPETVECADCDGTGWRETSPIVAKSTICGEFLYSQIEPCDHRGRRPLVPTTDEVRITAEKSAKRRQMMGGRRLIALEPGDAA